MTIEKAVQKILGLSENKDFSGLSVFTQAEVRGKYKGHSFSVWLRSDGTWGLQVSPKLCSEYDRLENIIFNAIEEVLYD